MTSLWPWSGVMAVALMNTNLIICMIKWKTLIQSLWNLIAISPGLAYHPKKVCRNSVRNFSSSDLKKIRCVFSRSNTFGHIAGIVGMIDVKRKGCALVGYWVKCVTSTFDVTHDLDPEFFKAIFWNRSSSGIGVLKWNKKNGNRAHDIDLNFSRSKIGILMGGPIGMERN